MNRLEKIPMLGILGGILFVLAVFAVQLGLDNDAGWGKSRILMAIAGAALMAVNWILVKFSDRLSKLKETFASLEDTNRARLYAAIAVIFIAVVYFWYALPAFENPEFKFDYYGRMATAFRHGQVHLIEEPPQSLLSLSDPYDYALRYETGVVNEIPIDISLYEGKYYLYWGPAPSLFLMVFNDDQISQIKDKYIGYLFACGVLLYLILFILKLWEGYRHDLSVWFIPVFALIFGLSTPAPWMVKTSGIYEAAIFGGQFFLIGGFYWTYAALHQPGHSRWKLLLGGIHWAFAMGTRLTVWPAIFLGAVTTLVYLVKDYRLITISRLIIKPVSFALPLCIALLLLGWYNFARFDSLTEFGLRYQLANTDYRKFSTPFSTSYIRGNLHNYFTYPVMYEEKFPFMKPTENVNSNERLAGLLFISPWILFGVILLSHLALAAVQKWDAAVLSPAEIWFLFSVGGSLFVMLTLVLTFYFPATRYIEDFMPLLSLFTFFLLARVFAMYKTKPGWRSFPQLFALVGFWSIIASLLISLPMEHVVRVIKFSIHIRNWLLGFGVGQ